MPTVPVSQNYITAMVSGSSTGLVVYANLNSGGNPVTGYQDMPVEQAAVSADRDNEQRQTASVVLTPNPVTYYPVPVDLTSPVSPGGNEIVLSAGWRYQDGTEEIVPIGVFPIVTTVSVSSAQDYSLTVTIDDRSWSIARRALLTPYIVSSGITVDEAITALIASAINNNGGAGLPPIPISILPTVQPAPPNTFNQGDDPWQDSLTLAGGVGYELFADQNGSLIGRPIPTPGSAADWTYGAPGSGSTVIPFTKLTRTLTADGVSNNFVIATENSSVSAAIQGSAEDNGTSSPTNVNGPFGNIPTFATSQIATNVAMAAAEASYDLQVSLGQIDIILLETVLNPALTIDDVISVTDPRSRLNGALYVVDAFQHNLYVGGTTVITGRRILN
jgi:hypothetical protein